MIKERSLCLNSKSKIRYLQCTWKKGGCTEGSCSDALSKHSEEECVAYSPECTYGGTGCVNKGTCTSYNMEEICLTAKTTDIEGCVWS
jgi:hypothetical protein